MHRINLVKLLSLLLLTVTLSVNAQHDSHNEATSIDESTSGKDLKTEIKEYINHHLLDSHDFSLFSYEDEATGEHVYFGAPLPVILWDNGLHVFSSSKLKHGEAVAEVNGNYYKLYHGKIYKTDAEGTINYDEHHHATNAKPLDFSLTKNVVFIIFVGILMFLMFSKMAKNYKKNALPTGIGRILEPIILYVRDDIAIPNIGKKHYKKYMSYLLTIFFFVWIINLLGLTPLGVNVTNNIAVTLALALMTYFITTFSGNKDYWKHIFWMPGVPVPMKIFLAPIEVIGMFVKPISLMIRLFANITAGHIIVLALMSLIFVFKSIGVAPVSVAFSLFISVIEIIVTAIQAYIFTVLSALYFGMATEEDHH